MNLRIAAADPSLDPVAQYVLLLTASLVTFLALGYYTGVAVGRPTRPGVRLLAWSGGGALVCVLCRLLGTPPMYATVPYTLVVWAAVGTAAETGNDRRRRARRHHHRAPE